MDVICDIEQLEVAVGAPPLGVLMKSIDRLDQHCVEILALSPAAVLGYRDGDGRVRATVIGGRPGFAEADSPEHIGFPAPRRRRRRRRRGVHPLREGAHPLVLLGDADHVGRTGPVRHGDGRA